MDKLNKILNNFSVNFSKNKKGNENKKERKEKENKKERKGKEKEKEKKEEMKAERLIKEFEEEDDMFLTQVFGVSATPYEKGGYILTKAIPTKTGKEKENGWHQVMLVPVSGAMPVVDDLESTDATKLAKAFMLMADTMAELSGTKQNETERNEMRRREAVRALGMKCCLRAFVKSRKREIGNGTVFMQGGVLSVENNGHSWNLCVGGNPVARVDLGSPASFDQAAASVPMDVWNALSWDDVQVRQLKEPTKQLKEKAQKVATAVSEKEQKDIKKDLEDLFQEKSK